MQQYNPRSLSMWLPLHCGSLVNQAPGKLRHRHKTNPAVGPKWAAMSWCHSPLCRCCSSVRKGEPNWSEGGYPNYCARVVEGFEVVVINIVAGKVIDNGFQGLGLSDTRLRQEGWCMVLSLVV